MACVTPVTHPAVSEHTSALEVPFIVLTLLVEQLEEHLACKKPVWISPKVLFWGTCAHMEYLRKDRAESRYI